MRWLIFPLLLLATGCTVDPGLSARLNARMSGEYKVPYFADRDTPAFKKSSNICRDVAERQRDPGASNETVAKSGAVMGVLGAVDYGVGTALAGGDAARGAAFGGTQGAASGLLAGLLVQPFIEQDRLNAIWQECMVGREHRLVTPWYQTPWYGEPEEQWWDRACKADPSCPRPGSKKRMDRKPN